MALDAYEAVYESPTAIQVSLTIALLGLTFFPACRAQLADGKDMAYAVARGAGASLKYLLPSLFVPTLRTIHAKVHEHMPSLVSLPLIGKLFHHRMSLHKYTGSALLAAAVVHGAAHGARRSVSITSQEGLTGIAMHALAVLPIFAMYCLRSGHSPMATLARTQSYYRQFLLPHQIGWWGIAAACALHTRDYRLLPWSLGAFGLFSADRVWEWAASRDVAITGVEKAHKDLVVIETNKPLGYAFKAGQKAYIAYPAATAFVNKLHPFTIASGPDEACLRFVISAKAKWTRRLVDNIKKNEVIRISPAYPSPLDATVSSGKETDRLFITSGAGIAMTLAHLNKRDSGVKNRIIHTSRHREEFALLERYVKDKKFNVVAAEYYDTTPGMKSRLRARKAIHFMRFTPASNRLLSEFKGRIFYCGNESLGHDLEKVVSYEAEKTLIKEMFNL